MPTTTTEPEIKARFKWHGQEQEATAVNPGGWFGKTWLIYVADCFSPPLYIVEADSFGDAIDEFVESDYGKIERIEHDDPAAGDYGFKGNPGDIIGGIKVTEKCWINLKGEVVKGPLTEPGTTGNGQNYDSESMMGEGREGWVPGKMPFPCRYFGKGLPLDGVLPTDIGDYNFDLPCTMCDFPVRVKQDDEEPETIFCSQECKDEYEKTFRW